MIATYTMAISLAGLAWGVSANAQVSVPNVVMKNGTRPTSQVSAAEAAYHIAVQDRRTQDAVSFFQQRYPKDSMQRVVTTSAVQWAVRLEAYPIRGMQLDPLATVSAQARQDAAAKQQIALRLATPHLSVTDKAYTYLTAVTAFASADFPVRLRIAEEYVTALDALGDSAVLQRFRAHRRLAGVYYLLGRTADVVRHGLLATALAGAVEFPDRQEMFWDPQFYSEIVDALSGQPQARARITALNTTLAAAATAPPSLLAQDSDFVWQERNYHQLLDQMMRLGMRLGTQADDLVSNDWVNFPRPESRSVSDSGSTRVASTMSLADGTIHIVELGHYSCPQCLTALGPLQRLQDRYPNIRVIYVTSTEGHWGNRIVEPAVEAQKLAEYYTRTLHITFPIAIWQGVLKPTADGGQLPEDDGPNFAHYPMAGKPNIYIIDGKGRIRRVYVEAITREREAQMSTVIAFLKKEASLPASPAAVQ